MFKYPKVSRITRSRTFLVLSAAPLGETFHRLYCVAQVPAILDCAKTAVSQHLVLDAKCVRDFPSLSGFLLRWRHNDSHVRLRIKSGVGTGVMVGRINIRKDSGIQCDCATTSLSRHGSVFHGFIDQSQCTLFGIRPAQRFRRARGPRLALRGGPSQ